MSNFNYNKRRYLELLKLKYLKNSSLNSDQKLELSNYLCILDNTLDWGVREQYLDLLFSWRDNK